MLSDGWIDFVAGWVSGAAAILVVQPVDTWLTRVQANVTTTTSTFSHSKHLWRGSAPMMYSVPFQNALLMGGYGVGQGISNTTDSNRYLAIFAGGCTGGILQSFLMSPVEWVKVQSQLSVSSSDSISLLFNRVVRQSGCYKIGLSATLLRDAIPHGVWFVSYEYTKVQLQQQQHVKINDVTNSLVSGAVAATVAWGVGYPFDIVKTRIQAAATPTAHTTVWHVTQQIIDQYGYAGLYRGFGLKLLRSIPASMIGFTVYEYVKKSIQDY